MERKKKSESAKKELVRPGVGSNFFAFAKMSAHLVEEHLEDHVLDGFADGLELPRDHA